MSKLAEENRHKCCPLNIRATKELRRRVEEGARVNGRSMANEVEHRLVQAYAQEDLEAIVRTQVRAALKDALYAFTMWQQGRGLSPLEDEDEPNQRPQ